MSTTFRLVPLQELMLSILSEQDEPIAETRLYAAVRERYPEHVRGLPPKRAELCTPEPVNMPDALFAIAEAGLVDLETPRDQQLGVVRLSEAGLRHMRRDAKSKAAPKPTRTLGAPA